MKYVDNGIYRSGLVTAENFDELITAKIKTVISLKTDRSDNETEEKLCMKNGIKYINLPITLIHTPDTFRKFFVAVYLMNKLEKPLLLHCTHGKDRTGISVALYRIMHCGWDDKSAIKEMVENNINPMFSHWKDFLTDNYFDISGGGGGRA